MTITYAKVGGPPDNWWELRVLDLDTGKFITEVIEVNTAEGWLVRYKTDENGQPIISGLNWARERVEGNFEIRAPE